MGKKTVTEIRWHGRGGQGMVTAGKVLAETALEMGEYFQAFSDHELQRSGAPIRAFTRVSDRPIGNHNQVDEPDVVVVLDSTVMGTVDVVEGLKDDGVLIVNTAMGPEEIRERLDLKGGRIVTVDASHIALEELGREIANTPMLGAFVRATGLFQLNDLIAQTRRRFQKKMSEEMVEANVRAIERAAKEAKEG